MEYAIVKAGGKQYKVSVGSIIEIDRLKSEKDKEVVLENVLLWVSNGDVKIGKPTISGIKVKAKVIDHIKGDKIKVAKFKAKARYRRMMGFRPHITRLEIKSIDSGKTTIKVNKKVSKPSLAKITT